MHYFTVYAAYKDGCYNYSEDVIQWLYFAWMTTSPKKIAFHSKIINVPLLGHAYIEGNNDFVRLTFICRGANTWFQTDCYRYTQNKICFKIPSKIHRKNLIASTTMCWPQGTLAWDWENSQRLMVADILQCRHRQHSNGTL